MAQPLTQSNRVKTIREIMGLEPEFFAAIVKSPDSPPAVPTAESATSPAPVPSVQGRVLAAALPQVPTALTSAAFSPGAKAKDEVEESLDVMNRSMGQLLSRDIIRYPLIFVVAMMFFYVILNFHAITLQIGGLFARHTPQVASATTQVPADYYTWIKKYYVYVNDPNVLLPTSDPDQDGLTNIEEYYLGTNPFKWSTNDTPYSDGENVINGYNPLYPGRLTPDQQNLVSQHVNTEDVRSRLALAGFQNVAGARTSASDSRPGNGIALNYQIDISRYGNISIPKIGVDAPIVWTKDFTKMINDLKYGTAHHPDTPYPGERGMVSIHGHSSGNPGDGNFKTVFTKLNFLEAGDDVFITVYDVNGNSHRYHYVVRYAKVYALNDPQQFADLGGYFLNLSTSWPIGTAHQRYVVTTELVGI